MSIYSIPTISELDREQLETHLEDVRTRRMVAAITYHQGVNAKIQTRDDKLNRQLQGHYLQLGKKIAMLDRLIEDIEFRANKIEAAKAEQGLLTLQFTDIPEEE